MPAVVPPERNAPVAASCRTATHLTLEPLIAVVWFDDCWLHRRLFQHDEDAWEFAVSLPSTQFDPSSGTMAEYVDRVWLPLRWTKVSKQRWTAEAKLLRANILPALGRIPLAKLEGAQILHYLERERRRGLSVSYLKLQRETLRSICRLAREHNVIDSDLV